MLQHLSIWQDFDFLEENFLFLEERLVYKKVEIIRIFMN